MRSELLTLWLALAGISITAADVPLQPNFDLAKFAGKWYPIQLVLDNAQAKDVVVVSRLVTPGEDGQMRTDTTTVQDGKCFVETVILSGTDQPGKFTIVGGNTLSIVETDYSGYNILHVNAKTTNILHLESRTKEVSEDTKERFKEVATELGFPLDQIVDIKLVDEAQCA